ncbi:MAG TPA: methyltransferase domain-containing protein [Burkholderiales bacterium]
MHGNRGHLALAALLALPASALPQGADKDLDTPYVPTPEIVVKRMLKLADVRAGETVIDLGSGDGRLVIAAALKYGARGFGVDLDPRLVERSNEAARRAGVADRVKFLRQDLFQTDFRAADVLTLYLLPDVNMALRPKILSDLRPGTRVVSHDFGMQEWRPDAQETVPAPDKTVGFRKESAVYLWVVPARVEGDWSLEIVSRDRVRTIPLALRQEFQMVSGSVKVPAKESVPVSDGRLRGDELRLALPGGVLGDDPVLLVGRVAGDSLRGSVRRGEREIATWSARRQP